MIRFGLLFICGFLLSSWLAKRHGRFQPSGLFAIPLSLLLFSGYDIRLWGLGLGLLAINLGSRVRKRLNLSSVGCTSLDFLFLLLAGLIAYQFGFRISFLTSPAGGFLHLSWISLPLTLIWIAAVSHSLSFLNSSGEVEPLQSQDERLFGKVAFVSCLAFLAIDLLQGQPLYFAISLVLGILGVLAGVLLSSGLLRLPLSNSGTLSQGLGFSIALLSIAGVLKVPVSLALIAPVLILGVPMVATSYAIVYGRARPPTPFINLLLKQGFSPSGAILLTYITMSYLGISLILISRYPNLYTFILILGTAACFSILLLERERLLSGGFVATSSRNRIFEVSIDRVGLKEAVDEIEGLITSERGGVVATPDTTAVMRAQGDERLKAAYKEADLVTADGIGLVWASWLLGAPLPGRVTGIDMIYELCHRGARHKQKLFLLGAKPGVAEEAKRKLEARFSGLEIVGTHHGYFRDEGQSQDGTRSQAFVISKVREAAPDILLVGMGVPQQELWIMRNKSKLGAMLIMGVGGSFDVISGRIPRAPLLLQQTGLEWLYRAIVQPRRFRRALLIPLFIFKVILLKIFQGSLGFSTSSSSS